MNCSICGLPKGDIVGSVLHQCMCGWQKPNPPVMPQQRAWVGLHDWEIKKLVGNDRYTDLLTAVAIAVEKELKARNT